MTNLRDLQELIGQTLPGEERDLLIEKFNELEFIEENAGLLFGDVINGHTGNTAEDILCQVRENPQADEPDIGFFYSYSPDTGEVIQGYSIQEIADIIGVELETE